MLIHVCLEIGQPFVTIVSHQSTFFPYIVSSVFIIEEIVNRIGFWTLRNGKIELTFCAANLKWMECFFRFFFVLVQQTEFLAHHTSNSLIHTIYTYILVYWSCSRIQCNIFLCFCTSFLFYFFYTYNSNNRRNRDTFPSATVVNVVCVLCIAPSSEQIHMLYLQLNWSCFWFWCCCRCHCCRAGSDVPSQSIHIHIASAEKQLANEQHLHLHLHLLGFIYSPNCESK